MTLSHAELLFNLFRADILIRIPYSSDIDRGDCIINIEVYNKLRLNEKKRRFNMRRDEYLKSRGVFVKRIEASLLRGMSEKDVKEWVLDTVAHALIEDSK